MHESIAERRSCPRATTTALRGYVGRTQRLEVLDLSPHGARIATSETLVPGKQYRFELGRLWLSARVVRCALVEVEADELGGRQLFEAGIAFEPGGATQERELARLLAGALPLAA